MIGPDNGSSTLVIINPSGSNSASPAKSPARATGLPVAAATPIWTRAVGGGHRCGRLASWPFACRDAPLVVQTLIGSGEFLLARRVVELV